MADGVTDSMADRVAGAFQDLKVFQKLVAFTMSEALKALGLNALNSLEKFNVFDDVTSLWRQLCRRASRARVGQWSCTPLT